VRDAAGELPDGFHLLRLAQLIFKPQALGQIGLGRTSGPDALFAMPIDPAPAA